MEKVLFETRGAIAYVTYNRPERLNACDLETYALLADLFRRFDADDQLRVAILSGNGERAFCAGSDIKGEGFGDRSRPAGNGLFSVLGFLRKPVIAAIHGHCNGGGLEQALACDIRVASTEAMFGLGEVRLGVLPGGGGTQRLPRLIPRGRALEMLYTGARLDAPEALRLGLVDHDGLAFRLGPLLSTWLRGSVCQTVTKLFVCLKRIWGPPASSRSEGRYG